jgi:hypothetical protein
VVRYADDAVLGFQHRADAERFLEDWRERLRKFGLELHPDKTRLIEFGRFVAASRKLRGNVIYALYHHVRLLSPEPMVVDKPQSTRVEEPTLLCNQVSFYSAARDPKFPVSALLRVARDSLKISGSAPELAFARGATGSDACQNGSYRAS